MMPFQELRFLHDPDQAHGFCGAALSSNVIHFTKVRARCTALCLKRAPEGPGSDLYPHCRIGVCVAPLVCKLVLVLHLDNWHSWHGTTLVLAVGNLPDYPVAHAPG